MAESKRKRLNIVSGQRYGHLVVISEVDKRGHCRIARCKCDCGNIIETVFKRMIKRKNPSCGCKRTTHGSTKTDLIQVWYDMRSRAKKRTANGDVCRMYQPWDDDFLVFKNWAYSAGYKKGLHICRNGDKGDYTPDNVRWDTPANNAKEAHSRYYDLISEDGEKFTVYNLSEFCREKKFSRSSLRKTESSGSFHKGFKIIKGAYLE